MHPWDMMGKSPAIAEAITRGVESADDRDRLIRCMAAENVPSWMWEWLRWAWSQNAAGINPVAAHACARTAMQLASVAFLMGGRGNDPAGPVPMAGD